MANAPGGQPRGHSAPASQRRSDSQSAAGAIRPGRGHPPGRDSDPERSEWVDGGPAADNFPWSAGVAQPILPT